VAGSATVRSNRQVPFPQRDQSVAESLLDDAEDPRSSLVPITVLSIKPVKLGRMFALASVEIDIAGLVLVLHRVRALRLQPIGTLIDVPRFRDENGVWRHAVTLHDEISGPIGKAVFDELVVRGLAVRSPAS
jgi:hypothetical protein